MTKHFAGFLARFKKMTPWKIGLLAATLLYALLALYTPLRFFGSDDTPILRSFMGYEGGVPARFNLIIHTGFAWLLYGLTTVFPGIAWYSILQLVLLWFSCVVIIKSMAQIALRGKLPLWAGALSGVMFLLAYASLILARISFTTTNALLGAAAVMQLLSIDFANEKAARIVRGMGLSVFLLLCAYSLRQLSVLPALAFWLLAVALIFFMHYAKKSDSDKKGGALRRARPLLLGVLLCAVSFGVFAGVRLMEIKITGAQPWLSWQQVRSDVFDFTNFVTDTPPETLEEIGWSRSEFALIGRWYFLDQNITEEALKTLYAAQPAASATLADKVSQIPATLDTFFADNPAFWTLCGLLALLCLAGTLLQIMGKPSFSWLCLGSGLGLGLGAVMLLYLAYNGRLPMRAAVSAIFPTGAFLLAWTLLLYGQCQKKLPRALLVICLALLIGVSGLATVQTAQRLYVAPPEPDEEVVTPILNPTLDAYALENPDVMIFYDMSLLWDSRLFPDVSEGIPTNLAFWGGWPVRSPSWNYQLSTFDIDAEGFTARDFLRENVVFASGVAEPPNDLLNYIAESSEGEIEWDFYDTDGYLYFFQFYEY